MANCRGFQLIKVILCWGLFALPAISSAQHDDFTGDPFISNYNIDVQIWAVEQDDYGTLFFGTGTGIYHFDGVNWKSRHVPVGEAVYSLLNAADGTVYLGGKGLIGYITSDSLSSFDVQSLNSRIKPEFSTSANVWDIVEFDSRIYFRTSDFIYVWDGETIEVIQSDYEFSSIDRAGDELWIGQGGKGVSRLINGRLEHIPGTERYADDKIRFLIATDSGYLIGSRVNGVVRFDGTTFTPVENGVEVDEWMTQSYQAVQINEGRVAVAGIQEHGIMIFSPEGKKITTLTTEDGLMTNTIYGLFVDSEKSLWAYGLRGISRISFGSPVTKFDGGRGLEGVVMNISRFQERFYAGTISGLYQLEMGAYDYLEKVNQVDGQSNAILETVGHLYVATEHALYASNGTDFRIIHQGPVRLLAKDAKTDIIFASHDREVFILQGHRLQKRFDTPFDIEQVIVHRNELWLLNYLEGVYRYDYDGNQIHRYQVDIDGREQYRHLGFIDSDLYMGTDAGLYIFNDKSGSFSADSTFGSRLGNYQVSHFEACSDREIWFRSNRKIQRFTRDGTDDDWVMEEDAYNMLDEGDSIDTIHCGEQGDRWFGGTNGLYHLSDPDWTYTHDFNTNISGLLIHNDSLIYGGYGDPAEEVTLPFSDNQFRFTYAAASFVAPEETVYRTRLRGYDDDWSVWTPETQKDYTFVPEGSYVFEVQGRNVYNKMGSIASFPIHILPPWYRTAWAYLGYVLLAGGLLFGLHRVRVNRIMKEQRIRNRIASDLHDEVSATLSSISYFAQAIRQTSNGHPSGRFVDLITESATDAKEKITDIIWSVDPENDSWVNLLSKCRRFASDLLESKGIAYDLEIATDIPRPLPLETRQHLWLIFKEMVTNAARHSGATEVRIRFLYENGAVRLVIQDNGSGWDSETVVTGNGIKNIQSRAAQLEGDLELETDESVGTRWTMRLEC